VIYIGLDDTDTLETRGTGHLARIIAGELGGDYPLAGVTRHQLLVDPRVPYTAKNSCAAIMLALEEVDLAQLERQVSAIILDHHAAGSDPGLAVAAVVPKEIIHFGHQAKRDVLNQELARQLAAAHHLTLSGLGGNHDGVIGALAAVGLAAGGEDGRYVWVGRARELHGLVPVAQVLKAGIDEVRTLNGQKVTRGEILAEKLRPARRGSRPVLFVQKSDDGWRPLRLD